MMAGMKIQLVSMLLLAFSSWSLCSDSEEEMKALEADLLTNMHPSKVLCRRKMWKSASERFTTLKTLRGSSTLPDMVAISKASGPSWKMTLLNVCHLVNNLNIQAEETGEVPEEELITRKKFPTALDGFSLEAMLTIYQLQKICHSRAFQHWELIRDDVLDTENDNNEKEEVIKRKMPYILKRQLYENKPRRPYILKRASYYY